MKSHVKVFFSFFVTLFLCLAMGACGTPIKTGIGSNPMTPSETTTSPTPTASPQQSLTPRQLLQKSRNAMEMLQTVHYNVESDLLQNNQPSASGDLAQLFAPLPGSHNAQMKGSGDVANNLEQIDVKEQPIAGEAHSGDPAEIHQFYTKDDAYVDYHGYWYVIKKNILLQAHGIMPAELAGYTQILDIMDLAAQQDQIQDQGQTQLDGQTVQHLTVTFRANDYQKVHMNDAENYSWPTIALDNIHNINATLDLWIEAKTNNVIKLVKHFSYVTNQWGTPVQENYTFTFSKFNEPITITQPDPAKRVDSVNQIYNNR